MTIKCCKDCTEREIGCHGWCETYIAEKAKLAKIRAAKDEQKDVVGYSYDMVRKRRTVDAKIKQHNRQWNIRGRR